MRQHEDARQAVQRALGARVQTSFVEAVAESADAERVIRDLAQQGNRIVFTPSFGYMEPTLKVARDFPGVKFESITGYQQAPDVATASARYYEGRYLAGIAAGRMSKTRIAGYVAGFPIPEVLQGIDAFTLGMRSVDPKAQVRMVWLDAWFDPSKERGKWAVAYHSDMRSIAPDAQIVAVTQQWGDYYTRRVQAVIDGTWAPGNLWGGVKEGMVRVGDFGPKVPQPVQAEVVARQKDIAAGTLQPFRAAAADIRDNTGTVVVPKGTQLSDEQILRMNWLVEGVQGRVGR